MERPQSRGGSLQRFSSKGPHTVELNGISVYYYYYLGKGATVLKTTPAFIVTRRYELAFAREPLVHTLPRASPSPSSSRERGGGMLDAPPLRQAGRLQRVDEAPPPRDLHAGWELLLLMILLLIWAGALGAVYVQRMRRVCAACVQRVCSVCAACVGVA